jgi:hypothetical protein
MPEIGTKPKPAPQQGQGGPGGAVHGTANGSGDIDRDSDDPANGTARHPHHIAGPSGMAVPVSDPRRAGPQGPRARPLGRGPGADAPGKRLPDPRPVLHGGSRENGLRASPEKAQRS